MTKEEKQVYIKTKELFDGCALCGNPNVAMHHIRFGACGRKTYMGNVIPLCEPHHRLVHSNKRKYQPLLIEMIDNKLKS